MSEQQQSPRRFARTRSRRPGSFDGRVVAPVSDLGRVEPPELEGLTPPELAEVLGGTGRARLVWSCLRQGGDPTADARLSRPLRLRLQTHTRPTTLSTERSVVTSGGTRKLRLRLGDGRLIETVLVSSGRRMTVCLSTQAGCARGCIFCLTATMGLERNLTAGEIVGQVTTAIAEAQRCALPPLRNVVFMGMGEPLDNLEAVRKALAVLCHPGALGLGPRHVTLSTVGTTPEAILSARDLPVQLAWSLHAVEEELRRRLVPKVRHSPTLLRQAFLESLADSGSSLFVEMTLIEGLNDGPRHAEALADFLSPLPPGVRVNLLRMNPGRSGLSPSPEPAVLSYRDRLRARGYFCLIRRPRGLEASAACGQLVT
jgi:23S rRNA (adenine2503-C2)-methyltransferase